MKNFSMLLLTITALLVSANAFSQSHVSKEEYAVYSALLNKMFEGGKVTFDTRAKVDLLVIKNSTIDDRLARWGKGDWGQVRMMLGTLEQEIIDNFQTRIKQPAHLKEKFQLDVKYTLVKQGEIEKFINVPTRSDWERFYKRYPHSGGFVALSRVGFNAEQTRALVYMEHFCHDLCATGHYVLLTKQNEEWKVEARHQPWIS